MKQIDGYIFANFHEYSLRLLIRVTTESGLRKIKTIIREKQKNRAIKEKNRKLEGKRTRDNIDITGREILENLNDEDMLIIDQYDNTILKSTLLNKE